MIDRITNRTAVAIAAVGLVAIVLVGWFAVVSPQRSKASELEGKIADSQVALAQAQALNRPEQKREITAEARTLTKAMPDQTRMSEILRQLSWAAKSTRVRVTSVTPAAAAPLAGHEAIPMAVLVEGRYFGIANFVGLLRKQTQVSPEKVRATGRLYSVDQIQFDESPDDKRFLQATLMINAYRFGGAAAAAAAAPAGTAATTSASAAPATTP
jgi:Tfp pilus assembly protein PilO